MSSSRRARIVPTTWWFGEASSANNMNGLPSTPSSPLNQQSDESSSVTRRITRRLLAPQVLALWRLGFRTELPLGALRTQHDRYHRVVVLEAEHRPPALSLLVRI